MSLLNIASADMTPSEGYKKMHKSFTLSLPFH